MTASEPQLSVFQMTQDPRLARLFAHVGELVFAWNEGEPEYQAIDDLAQDLLGLAPEFLPPDDYGGIDSDEMEAWEQLVVEATT